MSGLVVRNKWMWVGALGCVFLLFLVRPAFNDQFNEHIAPFATRSPNATPTIAPSPALPPTPLPPTPIPSASLVQLTVDGCCTQPFWSPDSSEVWFVDDNRTGPSGIWGVSTASGAPHFITERLGVYTRDRRFVAYLENGQTYVERIGGNRWVIPNGGRFVSFSPNGQSLVWQQALSYANFDRRKVELWVSSQSGTDGRSISELTGGWFYGWFPDNNYLLVSGSITPQADPMLGKMNITTGEVTPIRANVRLRGATLSPAGGWVAYMITFSGDPDLNGLWVSRTDGSQDIKLNVFGAYDWRGEGELVVIPLEAGTSDRVVEFDATTNDTRSLTNPALLPFRIAGGDWAISPDGARLAFVSAADHNLWLITLPPCDPAPCSSEPVLPPPGVITP